MLSKQLNNLWKSCGFWWIIVVDSFPLGRANNSAKNRLRGKDAFSALTLHTRMHILYTSKFCNLPLSKSRLCTLSTALIL